MTDPENFTRITMCTSIYDNHTRCPTYRMASLQGSHRRQEGGHGRGEETRIVNMKYKYITRASRQPTQTVTAQDMNEHNLNI